MLHFLPSTQKSKRWFQFYSPGEVSPKDFWFYSSYLINLFFSLPFYAYFFRALCSNILSASLQHAREKSKNMGRIEATHPKSPGWCSQMSSVELYMQYSRKTSVHPKNCRSPSPSSWGWSWALSAISSWMRGGGVWISGRMRAIQIQATRLLHQALVPKHEGITTNWNLGGKALN